MRTAHTLLALLLAAAPAAGGQQPPLITLAPTAGPALGPRTIVAATVACASLPTPAPPSPALHVRAPHATDDHEMSVRGGLVVLSGGTPLGVMPGQRYFTRRYEAPVDGGPASSSNPGSIRTSGWLTVVAADTNAALARVDYACSGVAAGDYLEPYIDPVLPATVGPDGATDFSRLGRVLFGVDRRESFGAGDLLSIDRGALEGITAGTRVAFYRDRRNGTPLVELGTGIVIEVSAVTSKVVVERSQSEVVMGDFYGVRRP